MPYHLDPSQAQNWNLSLQHQFGSDVVVSASYLGNHVIHMLMTAPLNPAIYFPGNSDASGNCFAQGYTFRPGSANAACSSTTNTDRRRILSLIDFDRTGQFVGALAEPPDVGRLSYNSLLLDMRKRSPTGLPLALTTLFSLHRLDRIPLNGNLCDSLNTYIFVDRDRGISIALPTAVTR
jgi:hypothetical protein